MIACGPWSAALGAQLGVELPVRPLCRQLLLTSPLDAARPAAARGRVRDGLPLPRRGERLVLAMSDAAPRWGFETAVDDSVFADRLERLVRRFPPAAGATIADAWAGLYDMTADAHPIIGRVGDGVYAACGFSGHGFMQSPAVGRALAEEILTGARRSTCRRTGWSGSPASPSFPRRSCSERPLGRVRSGRLWTKRCKVVALSLQFRSLCER